MANDNSSQNKSSDKSQTMFMIGIALIVIGIAIFYIGFTQPKIYVNENDVKFPNTEIYSTTSNSVKEQNNLNVSYPVNLNNATKEELMTIDGIGESKANLIINYRNQVGNFESIYDLENIKGFGKATIDKLAPFVTV